MREHPVGWKTIDRDSLAKISILPRRGFAGPRQRDVSSDDVLKRIRGVAWWPTLEEVRLRRSGDCPLGTAALHRSGAPTYFPTGGSTKNSTVFRSTGTICTVVGVPGGGPGLPGGCSNGFPSW